MTDYQFSESWGMLCRNYSKDAEKMEKREEDFFKSFRKVHADVFDRAVTALVNDVDRVERLKEYEKFPTLGEMRKYVKREEEQGEKPGRAYPPCNACSSRGHVSMILGVKFIDGEDKFIERHHWAPGKKEDLYYQNKDVRYYDYTFFCRCEHGFALHNAWKDGPALITPDEYEELKTYNETSEAKPQTIKGTLKGYNP